MSRLFEWIDEHPGMYPLLAGAAFVLLIGRCWQLVRAEKGSPQDQGLDWQSGLVVFLSLLAWRWPFLLDPGGLNPDEEQLIAGALTLDYFPAFWRSVDGTTSGPFNLFALLPTHWLGVPQDYFNARLTGLLLLFVAWASSYALLRRLAGGVVAYLALLPVVVFLGVTTDGDFLHYSSEHMPVALMCVGAWLLVVAGSRDFGGWAWWGAGLALGLLPWAKLQAGPLAAMLSVWACAWVATRTDRTWGWRLRRGVVLAIAVLWPTVAMVGIYVVGGEGYNFWQSYVLNNVGYAQDRDLAVALEKIIEISRISRSLEGYLGGVGGILICGGAVALRRQLRPGLLFGLGAVGTLTAIAVILIPGRGFLHYVLFLPFPLAWWSGSALRAWLVPGSESRGRGLAIAGLLALVFGLQLGLRVQREIPDMFGRFAWSWRHPRSELAEVVHNLAQPGDTLTVWGWAPGFYVQTGLPQATREAHTERQVEKIPQRDGYYRPRFMAELARAQPTFFIDSVGPGGFNYFFRPDSAHEIFPELTEYLERHYVFLADFRRERLYLRKDRFNDRAVILAAFAKAEEKWAHDPWVGDLYPEYSPLAGRPLRMIGELHVSMMEPPARVERLLLGNERLVTFLYGHDPKSYERKDQGNGTRFSVSLKQPNGELRLLWEHQLNPSQNPEDQGPQRARISFPKFEPGSVLLIETDPGPWGNNAWDWAYLNGLEFRYGPKLEF